MAASPTDIREWLTRGVKDGKDFMIVVCDTYDFEDYPVFCSTDGFEAVYKSYTSANMQRIVEIYDLSMDHESQLAEGRAYHCPANFT